MHKVYCDICESTEEIQCRVESPVKGKVSVNNKSIEIFIGAGVDILNDGNICGKCLKEAVIQLMNREIK